MLIVLILFLAFGFYIKSNLLEIRQTLNITVQAMTFKMLFSFVLGLASFGLVVLNLQKIYLMVGIKKSFFSLLRLYLSALATGVVLPFLGLSGPLVFIEDAKKQGYSKAKALAAALIYLFNDYLAISILLILNFFGFLAMGFVKLQVMIPIVLFLILTGAGGFVIFWTSAQRGRLRTIIVRLANNFSGIFRKIFRGSVEPKIIAEKLLDEFYIVSKILKKDKSHHNTIIMFALFVHLVRIVALYFVFGSLGIWLEPQVLLAGYLVGTVLVVISPTPNGIGFVEGGMLLVFSSLGVSSSLAGTATIIYRGFQFWLPFFAGLFLMQHKQLQNLREEIKLVAEESNN